jgi:hypothetical protein
MITDRAACASYGRSVTGATTPGARVFDLRERERDNRQYPWRLEESAAYGFLSATPELTGACAAGYNKSLITLRFFLQVQVGRSSGVPVQ